MNQSKFQRMTRFGENDSSFKITDKAASFLIMKHNAQRKTNYTKPYHSLAIEKN
jgi:hypothetical protein